MKIGLKSGRGENLAERIYRQLKKDIFDFRLLPGDRFSENEIAERMGASRTPVREALFRLERETYVQVLQRSGWQVKPFDFDYFEELYDVRTVLECAAVRRLCDLQQPEIMLEDLMRIWRVLPAERLRDVGTLSGLTSVFTKPWWRPPATPRWRASTTTLPNGCASSAAWISPSRRASTPPTTSTVAFSTPLSITAPSRR